MCTQTNNKLKIKLRNKLLRSTMIAGSMAFGVIAPTLVSTTAFAQDYTSGAITGTVYNADGSVAAGTNINLKSLDKGFARTATTNAAGGYRFVRLPIGNYAVGLAGADIETVRVSVGATLVKDFSTSGNIDEVIATGVIGRTFDFEAATTGLTIDVDDVFAKTPVARSLAALTLLTPGVTGGDGAFDGTSNASGGNLVSISGSSVAENVYYVNGMNTTDFRNFLGNGAVPFEFYQQVQTKTGGLPAEFGRTTGGVSNAVTKSGSNEWHFGASIFHDNKELRASGRNTSVSANRSEISQRSEANLWVSGPIVEDRIFAYALYSPRSATRTQNFIPAGINQLRESSSPFYGGKLDINITDKHLLEFTGWHNFNELIATDNEVTFDAGGQFIGEPFVTDRVSTTESGGDVYIGKYTGELTNWLTVSALYGEQTASQNSFSATDIFPVIRDRRNGVNFIDVDRTASFNVDKGSDKRRLFRADADIYVDDMMGDHHFRVGIDREELTAQANSVLSGGTYFVYFDENECQSRRAQGGVATIGGTCLRVRERDNGGTFETIQTALYLQDSWEIADNLTLNLGIRNETFDNRNAVGDTFIKLTNQWAPRFSFSYQPAGDETGTLFGSASRYFLPVATNTNIRSAGAETFIHRWYEFTDIDVNFEPTFDENTLFLTQVFSDGTVAPVNELLNTKLQSQSMDELILGYSTSLDGKVGGELGNWNVGAAFTYTKLNRVIEDISIDQAVLDYCIREGIPNCEDSFSRLDAQQYILTNPGFDATVDVTLPGVGSRTIDFTAAELGYPKAKRTYKALELKFDRVTDGPLDLHGSWTISESKGNYEGSVKSDNGQSDAGLTTDYDFIELTRGAEGLLPNHRAHKLRMWGHYDVSENISIGGNFQMTSPRKFGCLGLWPEADGPVTRPPYGGVWGCGLQDTPRGSQFESDWTGQLDLSLSVKVPQFTVGDLTLRVDLFNVTNQQGSLDHFETGDVSYILDPNNDEIAIGTNPNPRYQEVTTYQAPRYVRVGASWTY